MKLRQAGAAAVFVAISIVALLAAVFLAIDLGRLYFAQRSLQSMANMAAMDAAQVSGGCMGNVENPFAAAQTETLASVQRNGGKPENLDQIQIGQVGSDGGLRFFSEMPATRADETYAVRVALKRPAPSRLFPFASADDNTATLHASAAASSQPTAELTVAPGLTSANPPLFQAVCAMLGVSDLSECNAQLELLSSGSLGGADFKLGNVIQGEVTPESVRKFLNNNEVAPGLLDQIAQALEDNGNAAAAQAVQVIADASDAAAQIVPGDIFDVHEGFEKPASAAVFDAAAVVTAAAEAAKGATPITVGPITVVLPPPLGPTVTTTVTVLDGLSFGVGPGGRSPDGEPRTEARGAQVSMQIEVPLDLCASLTGLSGLTCTAGSGLMLFVQSAEAHADIGRIHCPQFSDPTQFVLVNAGTDIARIGIEPATILNLTLPVLGTVGVMIEQAEVEVPGAPTQQLEFDGPFDDPSQCDPTRVGQCKTISGSEPGAALSSALTSLASDVRLTCTAPAGLGAACSDPLVQQALQTIASELGPALAGLDDPLFKRLLTALGASVGNATITVSQVDTQPPTLIGR